MNAKNKFWILTTALLFVMLGTDEAQAEWRQVGAAGFTAGEATITSLAIDSSNTPYVAYSDGAKTSLIKFDGVNWVQVGSAGFSGGGHFISLAFDSNDVPYVAAEIGASVIKFDGSNWVRVGTVDSDSVKECAQGINLVLDGSNVPYIAYNNLVGSCYMMSVPVPDVMKFDGTDWVQVQAAGTGIKPQSSLPEDASYPRLAVDSNNVLYAAYADGAFEEESEEISVMKYRVSVIKFDGVKWVQVGNARFSSANAEMPRFAFDPHDVPYVAYVSDWGYGKVGVKKFNGMAWVQVGAEGFASVYGYVMTNLAVDSTGTPYVAFFDEDNGQKKASVMKFDGSSWVQVGKLGFTPGYAIDVSLAIDSNNIPYVAYSDSSKENRLSVMKFDPSYHPPTAMPWLPFLLKK